LKNNSQGRPEWHNAPDHTGDLNGRMMVTNASYTPGEFYRDTVYGLSSTSNYSVYLYAMNVNTVGTCSPNPILPRLQLVVEAYHANGTFTELSSLISEDLPQTASPTWVKISGIIYLPVNVTAVRYRIINNATGGCGNDIAIDDITFSQCAPSVLPVRGLSLKASNTNKVVSLDWSVLQESDMDKYLVQKSDDGKIWSFVQEVKSAGNSTRARQYAATDNRVISAPGYYRVIAVSINGALTYSNTIVVRPSALTSTLTISAYPNPFMSSVGVELSVSESKPGSTIRIFDLGGRMIKSLPWNLKEGTNITTINSMDDVKPGMYFLDITDRNGLSISNTRLVKR